MKRIIRTPQAKRDAVLAKDAHMLLVSSQIADFLLEVQQWRSAMYAAPSASSQVAYLAAHNLAITEYVRFLPEDPAEAGRFEHVRLQVCGACSFALRGVSHSAYNFQRGNATVYVFVELDVALLPRLTRWVPAKRLTKNTIWKSIT